MGSAAVNILTCVFILLISLMEKKTANQIFFRQNLSTENNYTHILFYRLRTMLKDANRRSKNPVDLEDLLDLSDEGEGKKNNNKFVKLMSIVCHSTQRARKF